MILIHSHSTFALADHYSGKTPPRKSPESISLSGSCLRNSLQDNHSRGSHTDTLHMPTAQPPPSHFPAQPVLLCYYLYHLYTSSTQSTLIPLDQQGTVFTSNLDLQVCESNRERRLMYVFCIKHLQLDISGLAVQCLTDYCSSLSIQHEASENMLVTHSPLIFLLLLISSCEHRCPVSLLQSYRSTRGQSYRKSNDELEVIFGGNN